jgi:very-short-patch-repair endonuclease
MRSAPTASEALLWRALRGGALGMRVRRQHPIGPYLVDFYVPRARLVIEVDGAVHAGRGQRERDAARDRALRAWGLRVVRVPAWRVERELDAVVAQLRAELG